MRRFWISKGAPRTYGWKRQNKLLKVLQYFSRVESGEQTFLNGRTVQPDQAETEKHKRQELHFSHIDNHEYSRSQSKQFKNWVPNQQPNPVSKIDSSRESADKLTQNDRVLHVKPATEKS